MSIQIKKKFIKSQVIDGTKVLFLNEDSFKALNSQGQETELFKLSSGDKLVMLQMPQVSSDPVADEDLSRKKYVDDSLEVEMLAREAGDEALSEDLATETAARIAGDSGLQSQITQEVSDRQAAVSAEQSAREAADTTLQSNIDAEVTRAVAAEFALSGEIASEASAREAEDLTLLKLDGSRAMEGNLSMGSSTEPGPAFVSSVSFIDGDNVTFYFGRVVVLSLNEPLSAAQGVLYSVAAGTESSSLETLGLPQNTFFAGTTSIQFQLTDLFNNEIPFPVDSDFYYVPQDANYNSLFGEAVFLGTLTAPLSVDNPIEEFTIASETNSYKITNLADGVDANDAVNKGQLDTEAAARAAEDLTFLKLDGSRSMNADLSMSGYGPSPASSELVADMVTLYLSEAYHAADGSRQLVLVPVGTALTGSEGTVASIASNSFSFGLFSLPAPLADAYWVEVDFTAFSFDPSAAVKLGVVSLEPPAFYPETGEISYHKITGVADGVDANDAVNKGQLDTAISGINSDISDTEAALAVEIAAREAADITLQSNIDVEKGRIDAILLASDADKDSFAEIVALINSVDTENDTAFGSYVISNNAALADEVAARIAGDSALQSEIDAEEVARAAADTTLQSNIDAEASTRESADTALQGEIDAEETRAMAAEAGLASDIADEEARAIAAEGVLQANIDAEEAARIAAVSAEQSAREAADTALDSRLDVLEGADTVEGSVAKAEKDAKDYADSIVATEEAARIAGDATLQGEIDAEEARALAAEGVLASDIAAEETRALAAEGVLQSNIDAEETRAIAAEATLQSNIDAEETRALAAEGVLQSNIDVEKGRIDAILLAADADKDSFAEIVALINSVDTENDSAFASYVLSNDAAVAAEVLARVTLEGEFDSYVVSNDAALAAEVAAREAADVAIDTRLIALEANNYVFAKESFTLASGDLVYIDLGYEVEANSICAFVDRLGLHKDEDFTVSVVDGKTRLTWAGSVMVGGDEALAVGDKVKVTYARRV